MAIQATKLPRTVFEIDSTKYLIIKLIGEGSYGVVCSAIDRATNQPVAVKKITAALQDASEARMVLREVFILKRIKHSNIIKLTDVCFPKNNKSSDVYMFYELMETDLRQLIRYQSISNGHIQYFVYQMLSGLHYLHSENVIHRDLKPANIFLNANCDLKIGDLGFDRSSDQNMTRPVVSLCYRAPELLLGCKNYGTAIDFWSLGCIFAQMLEKQVSFRGKCELDQIKLILKTLGSPKEDDLEFIDDTAVKEFIKALPLYEGIGFSDRFPAAGFLAVDLLKRLLVFDPRKRISVAEALKHPYMAEYYEPHIDIPAQFTIDVNRLDRLSKEDEIKEILTREVLHFHNR